MSRLGHGLEGKGPPREILWAERRDVGWKERPWTLLESSEPAQGLRLWASPLHPLPSLSWSQEAVDKLSDLPETMPRPLLPFQPLSPTDSFLLLLVEALFLPSTLRTRASGQGRFCVAGAPAGGATESTAVAPFPRPASVLPSAGGNDVQLLSDRPSKSPILNGKFLGELADALADRGGEGRPHTGPWTLGDLLLLSLRHFLLGVGSELDSGWTPSPA